MSYTVDDPELVEKMTVDKQGRLYLGKDYKGKRVRVCLEVLDDEN